MRRRKYLFISLAAVILLAGLSALQLIARPRDYTLDLSGELGRKIVGTVTADGVAHKLEGTLPATFEYRAGRLEYAFAVRDGQPGETMSVHVSVGGEPWGNCTSARGVRGSHSRWGVAVWGGERGGISGMNDVEASELGE